MNWRTLCGLIPALVLAVAASPANASFITLNTPAGAQAGGQPVDVSVSFTTTTDTLTIVMQNLQADPTSVVQNPSGIFFSIDSGQTAGTLTSGTGTERTVNGDGTFFDGGTVSAGWILGVSGTTFQIDDLSGTGHAGPTHTLLGPPNTSTGIYTSAGGSIAGNSAHNPFLNQTVTFIVNIPGLTDASNITDTVIQFGTAAGTNVPLQTPSVPEPTSLAMLSIGLGSLGVWRLRRRMRKTSLA